MGVKKKVQLAGISTLLVLSVAMPAYAAEAESVPTSGASIMKPAAKEDIQVNAKITRDEAVKLARQAVEVPEDYEVSNVHFSSVAGYGPAMPGQPSWNVNFTRKVKNREVGYIGVTIHGDSGRLLNYNRHDHDPDRKPSYPPKADFKAAVGIAGRYLDGLNLPEYKEVRYNPAQESHFRTPLNGDVRYTIRYDRVVQGVSFPQNGIHVEVDGEGKVVGFQLNWWDGIAFEDAGQALPKEKVVELLKKAEGLKLSYVLPYEMKKERKPVLVYEWSGHMLDALTGKPYRPGGGPTELPVLSKTPLTEKPGAAPVAAAGKMLTKEEALKKITDAFKLPEGAVLEDASYYENKEPYEAELTANWNLRWRIQDPAEKGADAAAGIEKSLPVGPGPQVSAAVNARTGEIKHYAVNEYGIFTKPTDEKEFKVGYAEAKGKAEDFIRKLLPHRTHQLYLEEQPQAAELKGAPVHHFAFKRVIGGAEAGYEVAAVGIDRVTGEAVSFKNTLTSLSYPETLPEVVAADKALGLWLDQFDLELQYTYHPKSSGINPYGLPYEKYMVMVAAGELPPGAPASDDGKSSADAAQGKLVYVPAAKLSNLYEAMLDAATGEWKNRRTGEKMELVREAPQDIDGHWAARELRLMVEYQALNVKDGKVSPDQAATRGEMIKMLLTAIHGGYFPGYFDTSRKASFADVSAESPYFAYVEAAVDQKLVDRSAGEFNPDAPMSREELAELVVRALGYNGLAKTPGLFQLSAADADEVKLKGQVALAVGLGILTVGEDGRFNAAQEVTRAQAAVAFFRYLEKRAALQERFY